MASEVQRYAQAVEVVSGQPTLGPGPVTLGPSADEHRGPGDRWRGVADRSPAPSRWRTARSTFRMGLPLEATGLVPSKVTLIVGRRPGDDLLRPGERGCLPAERLPGGRLRRGRGRMARRGRPLAAQPLRRRRPGSRARFLGSAPGQDHRHRRAGRDGPDARLRRALGSTGWSPHDPDHRDPRPGQALRRRAGGGRHRPGGRPRRDLRAGRSQRRRQDDDHAHPGHPAGADRRRGAGVRHRRRPPTRSRSAAGSATCPTSTASTTTCGCGSTSTSSRAATRCRRGAGRGDDRRAARDRGPAPTSATRTWRPCRAACASASAWPTRWSTTRSC